jgi:hypothetical protein
MGALVSDAGRFFTDTYLELRLSTLPLYSERLHGPLSLAVLTYP